MKKFFMIMSAVLMLSTVAKAGTPVKTSKLFDNTYIKLNIGASGDIAPSNWGYEGNNFFQTVMPTTTLRFGKWITPSFGIELQGESGFGTLNVPTFVDHTYVGANTLVNLNNLFHGYRGKPDKVEFVPYVGIGWWHSYGVITNNIATQYGLNMDINLGKTQAWQLNVVPQITYLLAGDGACQGVRQPHFDVRNAYVGLQVGVTYKFKNQYGKHNFVMCDKKYSQTEMDLVNEEVNRLRQVNTDLVYALKSCEERKNKVERVVDVQIVERVDVYVPRVQFEQGSNVLSKTSQTVLKQIADAIKTTETQWTVRGYASENGSEEFNLTLSKERATAVKNALVELGVSEEQLIVEGYGETTKFSEDVLDLNAVVEICK